MHPCHLTFPCLRRDVASALGGGKGLLTVWFPTSTAIITKQVKGLIMRDLLIDELEHVYGGGGRGGDWGKPKPPRNKTSNHGRKSSKSRKHHGDKSHKGSKKPW